MYAGEDTIVAIATPPGEGGVGIVRMSGPEAISIAAGLFRSSTGRDVALGRGRVFHGHAVDAQGGVIDEVLLHLMRAPHSYTREDVAEINAHGGAAPAERARGSVSCRGRTPGRSRRIHPARLP